MHQIFRHGQTIFAVDIRSLTVDMPVDASDPATQKQILDQFHQDTTSQVKLNDAGLEALYQIITTPGFQDQ